MQKEDMRRKQVRATGWRSQTATLGTAVGGLAGGVIHNPKRSLWSAAPVTAAYRMQALRVLAHLVGSSSS